MSSPTQESRELVECVFSVFDLETTGLQTHTTPETEAAGIVQIAAETFFYSNEKHGFIKVCEFHSYCQPGIPMEPGASKATGITDDMLACMDAPPAGEVLRSFQLYLEEAHTRAREVFGVEGQPHPKHVLVAHNGTRFDVPMLWSNLKRYKLHPILPTITGSLDTLTYARATRKDKNHRSNLGAFYMRCVAEPERLAIQATGGKAHDARHDVRMLSAVLAAEYTSIMEWGKAIEDIDDVLSGTTKNEVESQKHRGKPEFVIAVDIESLGSDPFQHGMISLGYCVGRGTIGEIVEKGRIDFKGINVVSHKGLGGLQTAEPRCEKEFWSKHKEKRKVFEEGGIDAGLAIRKFRDIVDYYDRKQGCPVHIVSDNVAFDIHFINVYLGLYNLPGLLYTYKNKYRRCEDSGSYIRGGENVSPMDSNFSKRRIVAKYGLDIDLDKHDHYPENDAEVIYRMYIKYHLRKQQQ